MRCLRGALLPSIDLHHLRDIERINSSERIGRDQDDATVGIYLFLRIAEFYSLQDFKAVSRRSQSSKSDLPAGSFKCDRLVRSSLASSMAGFISGGKFGLLLTCSSSFVVSTVLDYTSRCRQLANHEELGCCRPGTVYQPVHSPIQTPAALCHHPPASASVLTPPIPHSGRAARPLSRHRKCAP